MLTVRYSDGPADRSPGKQLRLESVVPYGVTVLEDEYHSKLDIIRANNRAAMRAIAWLFHAKRTLTVAELMDIVNLHDAIKDFATLVSLCEGLIAEDPAKGTVSFVDISIRSVVERISRQDHRDWAANKASSESPPLFSEESIASECIYYLQENWPRADSSVYRMERSDSPTSGSNFSGYAARYWGKHAWCCQQVLIPRPTGQTPDPGVLLQCLRDFLNLRANRDLAIAQTRSPSAAIELMAGRTWMHAAAWFGLAWALVNVRPVEECRKLRNQQDDTGSTALHLAAMKSFPQCVKCLIDELDADSDVRDNSGRTWLHLAARSKAADMTNLIMERIQQGYDISQKDNGGQTILHVAALNGSGALFSKLLASETENPWLEQDVMGDLMSLALRGGSLEVVDSIMDRGLHATAEHLAEAITLGFGSAVQSLIEKGVEIDALVGFDNYGRRPIHIAAIEGKLSILERLMSAGADLEVEDAQHRTAVALAVLINNTSVAKVLLDGGAKASVLVGEQMTALEHAREKGYETIAKMLRDAGAEHVSPNNHHTSTSKTVKPTGGSIHGEPDALSGTGGGGQTEEPRSVQNAPPSPIIYTAQSHDMRTSRMPNPLDNPRVTSPPPRPSSALQHRFQRRRTSSNTSSKDDEKAADHRQWMAQAGNVLPRAQSPLSYTDGMLTERTSPKRRTARTWILLDQSLKEADLALGMPVTNPRDPKSSCLLDNVEVLRTRTSRIVSKSPLESDMYLDLLSESRERQLAVFDNNLATKAHLAHIAHVRSTRVVRTELKNCEAVSKQVLTILGGALEEEQRAIYILVGLMIVEKARSSSAEANCASPEIVPVDAANARDRANASHFGTEPQQTAQSRSSTGSEGLTEAEEGRWIYAVRYREVVLKRTKPTDKSTGYFDHSHLGDFAAGDLL